MRRISGSGFKGWPRPVSLCAAILISAATPLAAEGLNANQQRAFDIYKELIEINTVTATGDTAKAAEAMAARLRAGGFPDADVHAFSPAPRKGNLVARLRGTGARKPILLVAHIDVVPASREDWSTDPFKLIEQDGYFYARGSGDDKYMAAAFIANLIRYRQEGYKPDRDIIVALETDEEILDKDALGIQWLLKNHRDLIDAGTAPDGRPGVHEQTLAFYRLVEEIKAAHPGLEIESCSSGGARVDLGVLQRTDRIWVSDCIDPLERQQMNRWTSQLVPPELLGSHIASGRSHTTGRVHDLSFRAATAVFGHLGIEWDLSAATVQELADLREWISFYKANRRLLMGGDLVRVDFPDPTVMVYGILAPDRSHAIYTVALIGRSEVMLPGRLRFPGLDPDGRYRICPILVGRPPSGLNPPPWWGAITTEFQPSGERHALGWGLPADGGDGLVLSGATLASTGVMAAAMHPEHAILYRAEALD